MNIIEKVFGTHSQREIKMIMPLVEKVGSSPASDDGSFR